MMKRIVPGLAVFAVLLGSACSNREEAYKQGLRLESGAEGKRDYAGAAALYLQGCDAGQVEACLRHGLFVMDGVGVDRDGKAALASFRKACDAGSLRGCTRLGERLIDLQSSSSSEVIDQVQAAELFQKACDGADGEGCYQLGFLFATKASFYFGVKVREVEADEGRSVRSFASAVEPFDRACSAGDAQACIELSRIYRRGLGVERDDDKALEIGQKVEPLLGPACGAGDLVACYGLGDWFSHDSEEEKRFLQKACDGGHRRACMQL